MLARTLQQCLIFGSRRVQRDHVRDRQALVVTCEPLDHVPGTYVAFSLDSEIEPAAAAFEETLDHVVAPETDRELVAGHARLRDNEFRRAHPIAVANPDLIFQQAFRREVFTECAPGQFFIPEFATPKIVVLRWVTVHGFLRSAVNRQIGLLVALDIVTRDIYAA